MFRQLKASEARWIFDESSLPKVMPKARRKKGRLGLLAQEQALSALELGLGINQRGYNIFVVGAPGTGRTSTVNHILSDKAKKKSTPNDIVLLYNFSDRYRPLSIALPPSLGKKLKRTYEQMVDKLLDGFESSFESESYIALRQDIDEERREKTDDIIKIVEEEANTQGFILSRENAALTIVPAGKEGQPITEDEFQDLSDPEKAKFEKNAEVLESLLEDTLRRVRLAEKECDDAFMDLERQTADKVIKPLIDGAKTQWKDFKQITSHLEEIHEDILNRIRRLIPEEEEFQQPNGQPADNSNGSVHHKHRLHDEEKDIDYDEPTLLRYRVNVLVSHLKTAGAPVIHETHPTLSNLIGRIEQRVRQGETLTDFTRIRSGALYQANGGFLVLEVQDLLRDPAAWEGLKRSLKNRVIELDDPGEPGRMISVAALRPEPVPLELKVILIGTPEVYYALTRNDPDFKKLFKVKADFDVEMDRSETGIKNYLNFFSGICADEKLRKLSKEGTARILEHAVRLSGSQKKLTTRLGDIADLLREADYWAGMEKARTINADHVRKALKQKDEREGFAEKEIFDDIMNEKVIIETGTKVIGQINGMTIVDIGTYEFGVPIRITCRVGCGRGEIIDIEKETELGGPIHTKGTLILRGILADRFGKNIQLGLSATICMEQTYTGIDGDSASLAETCALFSMLSNTEIDQNFAITGSIDQRGRVQAVGGINEKIEGFFKLCQKREGDGYSVIIPPSNADELMLSEPVIEAVKNGSFKIYIADTFEDVLELLTGVKWGGGKDNIEKRIKITLEHLHQLRTQRSRVEEEGVKVLSRLSQQMGGPSQPVLRAG